MKGKLLVMAIIVLGVAGAGGTAIYWRQARKDAAHSLHDGARRAEAFIALLRANRLRGHAKERSYDARPESPGKAYLTAPIHGGSLQLVRAAVPTPGGGTRWAIYAFREDGRLADLLEDAEAHEVDGGEGHRLAIIIVPAPGAPGWTSIRLVTESEEALRIRGPFRLETSEGPVTPRAPRGEEGSAGAGRDDSTPGPDAPIFRHDPATRRFRGPPGGPGERWEVDRARSPRWEP